MDEPFSFRQTKAGLVQIFSRGRVAKTLRGKEAERFLLRAESADAQGAQLLMARATGQFKFGNERAAKPDSDH